MNQRQMNWTLMIYKLNINWKASDWFEGEPIFGSSRFAIQKFRFCSAAQWQPTDGLLEKCEQQSFISA